MQALEKNSLSQKLAKQIKELPENSGVYEYFDKDGKLLYIGKAKVLKNRVKSYFKFTPNLAPNPNVSLRIAKMISETVELKFIITPSEADALILENSLIKQLKPKYNILLRDDKTYPYIYVDLSEDFPRFEITRKVQKGKGVQYFGPYYKGASELLEALYLNFNLVQKKGCLKHKKACLFYQIKRCEAPCEGRISKQDYEMILKNAIAALNEPALLIPRLNEMMGKYAAMLDFEQAAAMRDKIELLKSLEIKVELDLAKMEDFEAFAVVCDMGLVCATRLSISGGRVNGVNSAISMAKDVQNEGIEEVYSQAILQAFGVDTPTISTKIYTLDKLADAQIIEEILLKRHGKKFSLKSPLKGEKRRICEIAAQNARAAILSSNKEYDLSAEKALAKLCGLSCVPETIEVFDNSHMQAQACVGAMIRYKNGKFIKSDYRHYHLSANNDYEQMRQTLTIRATRFDKLSPPDLWVIDGGEALLNLAKEIIASSGANVEVIAISKEKLDAKAYRAKGAAKDKIYSSNGTFSLATNDARLLLIQKLRDEAHRFAISFHQKTKRKNDLAASKLKQAGISEASLSKLVKFYGSFDKIYEASYEEVAKLTNKSIAAKISTLKDSTKGQNR
ncbi:excinuclease ABC subunit UvrC [Campylobacter sp. 19-13652]|uniref:excinuclease ABC subunit UvrC n=1 Tax=Campylobacter sp. 19-13652 TaxID=2840180 RepID=UPI001C770D80|nr:excinuclease ABC subunit UvrC [Campylobacter sp. 19-13652]BCX79213.1 UvrABC system protein C [Campylobacter sp. 19-13652]